MGKYLHETLRLAVITQPYDKATVIWQNRGLIDHYMSKSIPHKPNDYSIISINLYKLVFVS